ncbi:MAG TPA: IPTL-CTERM sorting domain-containing protein, partial [Thermoanaerobaculia bacterium]
AVNVASPVPAGTTQISDTASIADDGANGTDPTPANNTGSDTTPLTGSAVDLSITVSDGGASVGPGGTVTYTLTYANTGSIGATGVMITETVPANTTFNAGASTAGWSCTPNGNAGGTCKLTVGGLAAGSGNQTATFAVNVASPVPAGTTQISDTASIADDGANGTDPTPANNTSTDTTPVTGGPDLVITLAASPSGSVPPGGNITYTLTYGNHGSRGATGVTLTETVPAGTNFVSAGSTAGWTCTPDGNAGSTCTLHVGALAAGAPDATATFVVHVLDPLPGNVTSISDTASIADDGANGADPTPNNNSSAVTTPIAPGVVQVPTVSAAGLALLALLLAASGAWLLRRRRATARR